MGSSKKHKDKGKEKEREPRKRHRSRSRSPERTHHKESKRRDRRKDEYYYEEPPEKLLKQERDDAPVTSKSAGGDVSLSIEETNKLRAKLGLKPLQADSEPSSSSKDGSSSKKEDVHKPAENLTNKLYVEKLREKIAAQKEKRLYMEKVKKVKTLAESDEEDDLSGAMAWVNKSRKLEEEKAKADRMAKKLEEMDSEFGIDSLVQEEFTRTKRQAYTAKDLKGLKVGHGMKAFEEGTSTILTLKDKGVLEEDADVLENVNLRDQEKAKINIERKKNKPGYTPYEDEDILDLEHQKSLLAKYDEEIDGMKQDSFVLGTKFDPVAHQRKLMEDKAKTENKILESCSLPPPMLAREFYSPDEMVKFKKPRKVRKVKRDRLKADDLIGLEDNQEPVLGSRKEREKKYNLSRRAYHVDETNVLDDDSEKGIQEMLRKAERVKKAQETLAGTDKIAEMIKNKLKAKAQEKAEAAQRTAGIILNSTAEFCRSLGDIPTYGQAGNRDEEADELIDLEKELLEEKRRQEKEREKKSAWNEVDAEESNRRIVDEDAPILDEEPDVAKGIAAALQLAVKKGYLDKEVKKVVSARRQNNLEATNYTIEDKNNEEDRSNRRERYSGPVSDFKEKNNYKPDVKLEYIDDTGRLLNQKEAFRYLSHKFHGKGPGKNKVEKRMKKQEEEALMRKMSSTDTPLGTVALLQEKQKQSQSPYILLSGGSKALTLPSIAKQQ